MLLSNQIIQSISTFILIYTAKTSKYEPYVKFRHIHLSNIYAREEFRKKSFFSDIAVGVISGLGSVGYELALTAAVRYLEQTKSESQDG